VAVIVFFGVIWAALARTGGIVAATLVATLTAATATATFRHVTR
jgi:hypothetical protein